MTAVDESGAEIEGKLSLYGGVTKVFAEKRFACSVIFPLDPGTYTVSVASSTFSARFQKGRPRGRKDAAAPLSTRPA